MDRRYLEIPSPALGQHMKLLAYGSYGAPMVAFPSGGGRFFDFEDNGMVEAVRHLVEAGRLKLYCPDGIDDESWLRGDIDPHWRGVRHQAYQDFFIKDLVPFIYRDCRNDAIDIGLVGCSLGAYHAANFGLKFPQLFPYALCLSGRYDLERIMGASSGSDLVYFNNPLAYVVHLHGDPLEQLRRHAHLVLVCGRGAWEEKCLEETERLADLLSEKGIGHERDLWGGDVEHHWHWWRTQFRHHLERALE